MPASQDGGWAEGFLEEVAFRQVPGRVPGERQSKQRELWVFRLRGIRTSVPCACEGTGEVEIEGQRQKCQVRHRSRRFCPKEFLFYPDGNAKPWKRFWRECSELCLVLSENNFSAGKVEMRLRLKWSYNSMVSWVIIRAVNVKQRVLSFLCFYF